MLIAACIKIVIVNHFDIDFFNLKLLLEKVGLQYQVLDPISDRIFRPKNDEWRTVSPWFLLVKLN